MKYLNVIGAMLGLFSLSACGGGDDAYNYSLDNPDLPNSIWSGSGTPNETTLHTNRDEAVVLLTYPNGKQDLVYDFHTDESNEFGFYWDRVIIDGEMQIDAQAVYLQNEPDTSNTTFVVYGDDFGALPTENTASYTGKALIYPYFYIAGKYYYPGDGTNATHGTAFVDLNINDSTGTIYANWPELTAQFNGTIDTINSNGVISGEGVLSVLSDNRTERSASIEGTLYGDNGEGIGLIQRGSSHILAIAATQ